MCHRYFESDHTWMLQEENGTQGFPVNFTCKTYPNIKRQYWIFPDKKNIPLQEIPEVKKDLFLMEPNWNPKTVSLMIPRHGSEAKEIVKTTSHYRTRQLENIWLHLPLYKFKLQVSEYSGLEEAGLIADIHKISLTLQILFWVRHPFLTTRRFFEDPYCNAKFAIFLIFFNCSEWVFEIN